MRFPYREKTAVPLGLGRPADAVQNLIKPLETA